jgi:tRNA-2-methylthio-N6-dimethylallyladenosine synthase
MHTSTDVIVGFPGETEEDFAQTRELFEACDYDMAYVVRVFHPQRHARGRLADQIPDAVEEERQPDPARGHFGAIPSAAPPS